MKRFIRVRYLHRCMTITVPGVSAVVTNMVGRVVSVSAST